MQKKKRNKTKKEKNGVRIFSVINNNGVLEVRFEKGVISQHYSNEEEFLKKVNNDEVLDGMLKRICEILIEGDMSKEEVLTEAAASIYHNDNVTQECIDNGTLDIIEKMKQTMNQSIERSYNPNI